jgi:hypothetical protein
LGSLETGKNGSQASRLNGVEPRLFGVDVDAGAAATIVVGASVAVVVDLAFGAAADGDQSE